MPLVAAAYLVIAAGLLTGFGGAVFPGLAVAGVAALAGLVSRNAVAAALALLGAASCLVADADEQRRQVCVQRLVARSALTAVLEEAASPGAYVRAVARDGACTVPVGLLVARGRAPPGSLVRVTGEAAPGARGVFVRRAVLVRKPGGDILPRWRAAAGEAVDRTFGSDAPVARALLVADSRSLAPELRDRYAAAGLIHLLSISGLHVGIIAEAVRLLLQALRLSRGASQAGAVAGTLAYVILLGAPPPALRAGVMLLAVSAARLRARPTSVWAALALGAMVPLVEPRTILELGYQLSVLGMAAIVAAGRLTRRAAAPRLDGWRLALARDVTASTLATIATAPLVAWTFGRLSLVGPLSNIAAGPILALAQPMLFLALAFAPAPEAARFIADAAHTLLRALDGVASVAAGVPFASITVAPSLAVALLSAVAVAAILTACAARFPGRPLVLCGGTLCLITWLPAIPPRSGALELHMIDVGQGDALALRTPRGRWILFDAGRSWRGGDAGRATVVPYLRRRGGDLHAFVLSHPHSDHAGGAETVLRGLRPQIYWDAAFAGGSESYRASLEVAAELGIRWRRVHPGDTMHVDGVALKFLAPDSAWTTALSDPNEASTVALVRYGAVRFLLVGDAEQAEEAWLLRNARDELEADVLKVAHHGSRTSSTTPFLEAVRPRIALIPVGAGNGYGHPSAEVLHALSEVGATVLRTDQVGSVVIRTDGHTITVHADGIRWTTAPASAPVSSPP